MSLANFSMLFFFFFEELSRLPEPQGCSLFCWVVQCKSTTKSMKMCLVVLKVGRINRMEVHVYAHDRCQANLSTGWLACACITIFHEVITIFFWQYSVGQIHFGRCILAPCGAHKCFELQYLKKKRKKKHWYQYKDFNHRCKGGYILGKTPVSLPITTDYAAPDMRQVPAKKRQSNREWQGKTARACIGSHTLLINGSWLLPTKRLFRSAANFDFHDNRPKMADLKSVNRKGWVKVLWKVHHIDNTIVKKR